MNAIPCVRIEAKKIRQMFIETTTRRIDELDVLKLKTECAMKLSIQSPYWSRKHRDTYKELDNLKTINVKILGALEIKKGKYAIH
jgi:hypothetical protein